MRRRFLCSRHSILRWLRLQEPERVDAVDADEERQLTMWRRIRRP